MPDNEENSLIPLTDGSLANATAGAQRVMSAMVWETLAFAKYVAVAPPTDVQGRLKWHLRAAERGSRESMYQLGVAFLCGDKLPEDRVEGLKWLYLAACQGHEKAGEYFDDDFDYDDESNIEAMRRGDEFETAHNSLVPAPDECETSSLAVTFAVTRSGKIERVGGNHHQAQGGFSSVAGMWTRIDAGAGDFGKHIFTAKPYDRLMFFTDTGRVYVKFASEIASGRSAQENCAITSFLGLDAAETVVSTICVPTKTGPNSEDMTWQQGGFLFFATRRGLIKKTALENFAETEKAWERANGTSAIQIEMGDELIDCKMISGTNEIMLVTKDGMSIRFNEEELRDQGRNAVGVWGIRPEKADFVVATAVVVPDSTLLVAGANGIGKRTPFDDYRLQSRGGKGEVTMKNGDVVAALAVYNNDEIVLLSAAGQMLRRRVSSIPVTTEVKLVNLEGNDTLQAIALATDDQLNAGLERK